MSSTNGRGLASPSTFIISPSPASLMAHTRCCATGSCKRLVAYAAVCLSAVARTCWSLDAVSDGSLPLTSTTRMSEGLPSRKSRPLAKPRERLACVMIISPMCSMAAGFRSSRATVASIASRSVLKCSTANPRTGGMGHSLSFACVTAASVPSEPTITWVRSRAVSESVVG